MKSIINTLGILAICGLSACGNSSQPATETTPPPASAPAAEQRQEQPKDHTQTTVNEDKTEVGINDKGVIYTNKKSGNETNVNINKDSNSISIKRRR